MEIDFGSRIVGRSDRGFSIALIDVVKHQATALALPLHVLVERRIARVGKGAVHVNIDIGH